jgi:small subunit ribosomal protein S8
MMTDPIADMLTRIRNAATADHKSTQCAASRLKLAVAKVLTDEGFLGEVSTDESGVFPVMTLNLRYTDDGRHMIDNIRRVSKPGRRVYVGANDVPKVRNGLGMMVLSTSRGVICDRDARAAHIGGEILCEVW